mmetsp:Transcript_11864/g.25473  ORF Transcript_11864/g.25473 Transcript_11864/m.25473 type:complete len:253 (-) Transcript_11864:321-1079(-)
MELLHLLHSNDKQLPEGSTPTTKADPSRQRIVLSKQQAVEIFRLKSCHGFPTSHAASAHLANVYKVSSKSIRDIWNGRSWLNATFDMWDDENRPQRRIVGRPKGKRDSRPRLSKSHTGLKTVSVCSKESVVSTSQPCQATPTAALTIFPDPIYKPTFPPAGGNDQISAMLGQHPYAFLQHTPVRSSLESQNIGIHDVTGFRPFSTYPNCQRIYGVYPSTSLAQTSLLLPWHACSSNTLLASVQAPAMQTFFQ